MGRESILKDVFSPFPFPKHSKKIKLKSRYEDIFEAAIRFRDVNLQ